MKLFRLETVLTLGLLVKAGALALALLLAWPLVDAAVEPVQAQEEAQGEKAQAENQAAEGEKAQETPVAPAFDPQVIALIEQKRQEVKLEEERLAQQKADLARLKEEVDQRIAEYKKVQTALEELVKTEQNKRRERVSQLVKVLSNMRPEAAAAVVEKLDDQMTVEIFKLMQSRIAGQVMGNLKPGQAARISEMLAQFQQAQQAGMLAERAVAGGMPPMPPAGGAAPPPPPLPNVKKPQTSEGL